VAPRIVHDVLATPGRPLDEASRAPFERRFGLNFAAVRIHADGEAARSALAVNARAYTVGRDIVFGPGRFAPRTGEGQRLLAHELAHVVQQGGVKQSGGPLAIGTPDAAPEREARAAADAIASVPSGPAAIVARAPVSLQRDGETTPAAAPPAATADSRPLTQHERDVAGVVFGPALNLDLIVIKESAAWTRGGYIRTMPDAIYVPPGRLNTIGMGLLIHELTHSAQYQHGVSPVVTAAHAIAARYDYGGEQGLRDAIAARKCFDHFNTEQQGDIVQDYYEKTLTGDSTYPWSVFIDQVRAQGACIWPTQGTPVPDKPPAGRAVG
jgi:hypothetical protein